MAVRSVLSGNAQPLHQRLCFLAGVDPEAAPRGGQYADEFRALMDTLVHIGDAKVDQYGDFRLQDIRNWERETWGAYWDILRKFGRLEQQLQGSDANDLMESCADLAVYAARMIQILLRLEEKGLVPNATRTSDRSK